METKRVIVIIVTLVMLSGCSWSKVDIGLGIASTVATAADFYTTSEFLDNPNNHETNPILGEHPSNSEIFMVLATGQIAALILAYFCPKLRPYILGAKTTINAGWAVSNYQLDWGDK